MAPHLRRERIDGNRTKGHEGQRGAVTSLSSLFNRLSLTYFPLSLSLSLCVFIKWSGNCE